MLIKQINSYIEQSKVTISLAAAVILSMASQFLVGYNTAVMNAPQSVVFPNHTTTQWSFAVAAFAVGGPLGALLGGYVANSQGRKGALFICAWIYIVGGTLMTLAPNVYYLIPARFIIGFAAGLSSVVVPVYLGEIAPPTMRGTLGTCTQFAMVIGILVTSIVAFPFATVDRWRYLFFITPALSALQLLFGSIWLLESPRWLLSNDPRSIEARKVIALLRGYEHEEDITQEVEHFLSASAASHTSKQCNNSNNNSSSGDSGNNSNNNRNAMLDLLLSKEYRSLVIAAIGLQISQQLCGINAVFYYSTALFQNVLDDPMMGKYT